MRKSTIAFLMTLPLIVLLVLLVAYPAGSTIWLSMLDRGMTKFVGFDNFAVLFASARFWRIVGQTSFFAITAVAIKAILGFAAAHFMHNIPVRAQRRWRGVLLAPWVIPPALSVIMLAWRELFDPSFGVPPTGPCNTSAFPRSHGSPSPSGRASASSWQSCGWALRSS